MAAYTRRLAASPRRSPERASAPRFDLAPEGLDAGVELVRDLLEGLVCLPGHDVEARVRDSRGHRSTEARRQDDVELARQDERRRGDLRKAIRRSCVRQTSTCA